MKKQIYLAGAMSCYSPNDEIYKKWRKDVRDWFDSSFGYLSECSFTCIDPTEYFDIGQNLHKTEKEIMLFDLRKVKSSNLILVNLRDIEKSPGTIDEVFYAWMNNIPIIGFLESNEENIKVHPWLMEQIDRIEIGENSMKKAMLYIKDYYGK